MARLAKHAAACFGFAMLSDYIAKAVEKADYEKMENGRYFATIPAHATGSGPSASP